jgi:hypothetical protein
MADRCIWTGASGTKYTFYVYPRHPRITPGQMGNYIYAKIDQTSTWQPILYRPRRHQRALHEKPPSN